MLNQNFLGIVDYIVVAFCLLFSLFIGIFFATKGRKTSNNEELLVGNRNLGAIPVAASILVSYLSAITILGMGFKTKLCICFYHYIGYLKYIELKC